LIGNSTAEFIRIGEFEFGTNVVWHKRGLAQTWFGANGVWRKLEGGKKRA